MVAAGPDRARPLSAGEHRRNRSHERNLMDPKKLANLSEDEVVATLRENVTEARQLGKLMVDAAGLVVRAGRMQGRTDDQVFGDVVAAMATSPQIDVATPDGIVTAVVVAEFALQMPVA
jgi:hypothetical protein